MSQVTLLKNNTYNFYIKNQQLNRTFHYKAKYIGTYDKVMQIYDFQKKDYIIFRIEDIDNIYPAYP